MLTLIVCFSFTFIHQFCSEHTYLSSFILYQSNSPSLSNGLCEQHEYDNVPRPRHLLLCCVNHRLIHQNAKIELKQSSFNYFLFLLILIILFCFVLFAFVLKLHFGALNVCSVWHLAFGIHYDFFKEADKNIALIPLPKSLPFVSFFVYRSPFFSSFSLFFSKIQARPINQTASGLSLFDLVGRKSTQTLNPTLRERTFVRLSPLAAFFSTRAKTPIALLLSSPPLPVSSRPTFPEHFSKSTSPVCSR